MVSLEFRFGKAPNLEEVIDLSFEVSEKGQEYFLHNQGVNIPAGKKVNIIFDYGNGVYVGEVDGQQVAFLAGDDIFEAEN